MTREEAIAVLQIIKPAPRRADGKSTTHTLETMALDMAIEALKQHSFETPDDKIIYCTRELCLSMSSCEECPANHNENDDMDAMLEHLWNDTADEESEVE